MLVSFVKTIEQHNKAVATLLNIHGEIEAAAEMMVNVIQNSGTIYWMGNGGSAADAQHYAAELMVRYTRNRKPIPSIALTTDTSLITAHSNDFKYETVFSRQVEALATENDMFVGISTSGNSRNVCLAMEAAKVAGAKTLGMLGKDGGAICNVVDISLIVECNIVAHIQEAHLIIGHYLCNFVENIIGNQKK